LIEKEEPILHLYLPVTGFFNFNFVPASENMAAASAGTASAARNYPISVTKKADRAAG